MRIGRVIDKLEGFNQGRTGFPCAKADMNGAYTLEVAIPTLRKMERYGIEAVNEEKSA